MKTKSNVVLRKARFCIIVYVKVITVSESLSKLRVGAFLRLLW